MIVPVFVVVLSSFTDNDPKNFNVVKDNGQFILKSCLNVDQYVPNLLLPLKNGKNLNKRHGRVQASSQVLAIDGGYWEGDCLMIPIVDDSEETIMVYINQMTKMKREDVTINKLY